MNCYKIILKILTTISLNDLSSLSRSPFPCAEFVDPHAFFPVNRVGIFFSLHYCYPSPFISANYHYQSSFLQTLPFQLQFSSSMSISCKHKHHFSHVNLKTGNISYLVIVLLLCVSRKTMNNGLSSGVQLFSQFPTAFIIYSQTPWIQTLFPAIYYVPQAIHSDLSKTQFLCEKNDDLQSMNTIELKFKLESDVVAPAHDLSHLGDLGRRTTGSRPVWTMESGQGSDQRSWKWNSCGLVGNMKYRWGCS